MSSVAGSQLERIARGGTAALAGAGVAAVANFAVVVVITQAFSKEDAGALFSASSLFLIVLAVAGLGIETGLGRFVLRHVAEGRWDWARACLSNTALVTVTVSAVAAVGLWVAAAPIAVAIGISGDEGPGLIRVFSVAVVAAAVGHWALGASRAFANIAQTVLIDKLARSLMQLGLVAACAAAATGLIPLAVAWVAPAVLLAPVAVIGLLRVTRATFPPDAPRGRAPGAVREFWLFTAPRSIAQVAQLIVQRLDIILIAAMLTPAAAAVYTAATRFVPLGQLGQQAIAQVVQPRFTHLLATGERAALGEVFRTTTAWNIAVAWPIYLVVASMAGVYLQLFGSGFAADGVAVVLVMAVGMLVGIAAGPIDTILLMAGRSWLSLGNALAALVIDLVGCLVLIPPLGILGAAVAWCAAIVTKSVLAYVQVGLHVGLSPVSRASVIVAVSAVVAFAVPGTILTLTGNATMVTLVALLVFGGAVYAAALWRNRSVLRLRALRALLPGRRRNA